MTAVADVVLATFARVVGDPPARGRDTTPADADGWDSLAQVEIVFEIEQTLGIQLPESALVVRTDIGTLIDAAEAAVAAV